MKKRISYKGKLFDSKEALNKALNEADSFLAFEESIKKEQQEADRQRKKDKLTNLEITRTKVWIVVAVITVLILLWKLVIPLIMQE